MTAKKLLAIFLFVAIIISGTATTVYAASEAVPLDVPEPLYYTVPAGPDTPIVRP